MSAREQRKSTSTREVQEILYNRRIREMERKHGLDKATIIEQVNDSETYKEIGRGRKRA